MEVNYNQEEDILMIVLPNSKGKKIDDTLEGENIYITVTKDGEPIMLEIFQASKLLNEIDKVVSKKESKLVNPDSIRSTSVLLKVKK